MWCVQHLAGVCRYNGCAAVHKVESAGKKACGQGCNREESAAQACWQATSASGFSRGSVFEGDGLTFASQPCKDKLIEYVGDPFGSQLH
eukprot:4265000-Karenia_brevis.AAC.1